MNALVHRSRRIMAALALFGLALSPLTAQAQEAATRAKKVVTVEGITEYQLDNGVRYLLFPDPSSATVTVNLTVFVGSRHEGYGETGMAHLLEHMLFKGSRLYPDVDRVLQQHGAQFNGTTWVDRTNYYETMPASEKNLEFAIKFEADRLLNSFIRREDLAKEMSVVRNEFEIGENNPEGILSQRMMAAAFEWHNYGQSTIGNRSDIERVPVDRLRTFYQKFYQPDNVLLVIAGKFDESKAHDFMQQYFAVLPRPRRQLEATYTEEPVQDGERFVTLRRVGTVPVVGLIWHTPAAAHPDCAAVQVLEEVLTAAPSGRLYKALVETRKATSVSGFAPAWHDPGILELSVRVSESSTPEEVREILLRELDNIQKTPVTQEEVDRARRRLLAVWERAFTKSKTIAIQISEWAGAGDWRLMFLHRDRISAMTAEHVNEAAHRYLRLSNRTVGLFLPTKADELARAAIPPAPDVQELVKDYRGGAALVKGEAFQPTPENIEKRVQRMQLPSGIKVALLPKKTRGEAVVANFTLHFGNEKSLKEYKIATDFLGALLLRGSKNHTRQQIQDELNKLGASLSASSSVGSLTFSIQAKRDTLPAVVDLLGEVLRQPTFPADEFDILKRSALQQLRKGLKEPNSLALNRLQRQLNHYPSDDVRYVPTLEEEIALTEKVTRDDVVKLYAEQVGGTVGELALVGDFEAPPILDKFRDLLADWEAETPYRRIGREANTRAAGSRERIATPDKQNAIYVAGYELAVKDTHPEYPALMLANYFLGGSGLNSVLFDRLRGKEGLSYGAGSQFYVDAEDEYGLFLIFAFCNPANISKVDSTTLAVLQQVHKGGINDEQLLEAKKGYLQGQQVMRANDAQLAALLRVGLYLNRTFDYYAEIERCITNLSVADVNGALQRLIQPARLVVIQAGDLTEQESSK